MVLTIAGSDCSGGAGLQADLKTFSAHGVYGTTAVTCVVVEHPGRVFHLTPIAPVQIADQIRRVREAFPIAAIKVGLLPTAAAIVAVTRALAPLRRAGIPVVVDPVMTASARQRLQRADALPALKRLLAQATLVTPNRDEAALLLGRPIRDARELAEAAATLVRECPGPAFLVKGGHLTSMRAVDVLALPDGHIHRYTSTRLAGIDPHGTGCTYAAAIAANLALGHSLPMAVARAKRYLSRTLRRHFWIGGYPLLDHRA